jgi:aspartate aminotransferase
MIRRLFEEGAELKKIHSAVFDFSLGNPDLDPPEAFYRTLNELAREKVKGSHGYMSNAGFFETRAALAKKASRDQECEIPASNIIMSAGAAGALNVIFKSILDAGDEVIVPKPYFMEYRSYVSNHGGKIVEVSTKEDFSLDLEKIENAFGGKTKAVLINSPNNPTGSVYPRADMEKLGALLKQRGAKTKNYPYLVADEPYREIVYSGVSVPSVFNAYSEAVVATSFSKSLSLPGERIGYIAVHPGIQNSEETLAALVYATRVLGFVNAPALMQRIVAKLTAERVAVEVYESRRNAFMNVLDSVSMSYARSGGAFYVFAKVPARKDGSSDDREFSACLKKHLILGVPGSGFGAPGWIRFAYCVDENIITGSAPAFRAALAEWTG